MLVTMLSLGACAGSAAPIFAQGASTGRYMAEAVVRVTDLAVRINSNRVNMGLGTYGYRENISVLGGWVNVNASLRFDTDLRGGVEYLFLADGDLDAEDIDLEIIDGNGNVVASDLRPNREAVVTFTPPWDGRYTMRLILDKSKNNVPCVCTAVLLCRNGNNWNVPVKNLDAASGKIVQALDIADRAVQPLGRRADLRRANNQWAFYGCVLRAGENFAITNMNLGIGGRVLLGAGDRFANIVNLDLENGQRQALKQDRNNLPVAVFDYQANGFGQHGVRVHNVQSNGPAVVLMAVLEVR